MRTSATNLPHSDRVIVILRTMYGSTQPGVSILGGSSPRKDTSGGSNSTSKHLSSLAAAPSALHTLLGDPLAFSGHCRPLHWQSTRLSGQCNASISTTTRPIQHLPLPLGRSSRSASQASGSSLRFFPGLSSAHRSRERAVATRSRWSRPFYYRRVSKAALRPRVRH